MPIACRARAQICDVEMHTHHNRANVEAMPARVSGMFAVGERAGRAVGHNIIHIVKN